MTMKCIPFVETHLARLNKKKWDFPDKIIDNVFLKEQNAIYTAFQDGKPVGFGGISQYWNGYGETWLMTIPEFFSSKIQAYKTVRYILKKIIKDKKFSRVEAHCYKIHKNYRFLEMLGFELAAEKRKYFPCGATAFMYEMVME